MITCERCNTENLDGSQYCDECGAILSNALQRARKPNTEPTEGNAPPLGSPAISAPGAGAVPEPSGIVADTRNAPAESGLAARSNGVEAINTSVKHKSTSAFAVSHDSSDVAPGERRARSSSGSTSAGEGGGVKSGKSSSGRRQFESSNSVNTGVVPHAKLVIHRGRSVGKEFPLNDDEAHIGRWDADGGIFPDVDLDSDDPEAKVSRRHARITRRSGQYFIEDLGSTNGTFINRGRRLLPGDRQPLRDGDEVIVGKTFLRFQVIK